jgi:AbrB family looped-hinge helix DNA binding protein
MLNYERVRLDDAGRIVIPARFRKQLGMKKGSWLVIGVEDGEVRIFTIQEAIRKVQETAREYPPEEGHSVVDDFIAERRAEAARE